MISLLFPLLTIIPVVPAPYAPQCGSGGHCCQQPGPGQDGEHHQAPWEDFHLGLPWI